MKIKIFSAAEESMLVATQSVEDEFNAWTELNPELEIISVTMNVTDVAITNESNYWTSIYLLVQYKEATTKN